MKYSYHRIQEIPGNFAIIRTAAGLLKNNFASILTTVFLIPALAGIAIAVCGAVSKLPFFQVLFPAAAAVFIGLMRFTVYAYSNLGIPYLLFNLVDGSKKTYADAFKTGIISSPRHLCATVIAVLIIVLKTLLFIVPGILAVLDYAMLSYIIANDKNIGPCEALKRSRAVMHGHRWQFFCLGLISFIPGIAYITSLVFLALNGNIILLVTAALAGIIIAAPLVLLYVVSMAVFFRAVMPRPESAEAETLPPTSGNGAFSTELNVILLIIIAAFYVLGAYVDGPVLPSRQNAAERSAAKLKQ